ncbi:MAG: MFS transporter [Gammaproteobacteria bacterium]
MNAEPYPRRSSAWYALFVLTLCYTLSYVDRQIIAFLVEPLKHELSISDTKIGLLQGIYFAIFYTFVGLPMGWLADRYNRRNIVAAGVLFWSVMTALSGTARSYTTLALARMGVGLGESTTNPCAFSMISDFFPKEKLSTALSVYMMGIQLGSGLALIIGGVVVQAVMQMPPVELPWLGALSPWRLTFIAVGLPGFLFALLVLTFKEPPRRAVLRDANGKRLPTNLKVALGEVGKRWQSVLGIALMIGSQALCNYTLLSWGPSFFGRVHQWPRDRIGLTLGLIALGSGCTGLLTGGRLADYWQRRGVSDGTLRVGLISLIGVGITLPIAMTLPQASWTVMTLVVAVFFVGLPIGCSYAALQYIFPNQVRGVASAVVLFVVNFTGLGLGSLLPGVLNDHFFRDPLKVGYSIALTVVLTSLFGITVVLLTMKPYRRHYAEMRTVVT